MSSDSISRAAALELAIAMYVGESCSICGVAVARADFEPPLDVVRSNARPAPMTIAHAACFANRAR